MLRVSRRINTVAELKKATYRILNKMHDLERGRKVNVLASKRLGKTACIVLCASHLKQILVSSLSGLAGSELAPAINDYLHKIDELQKRVESVTERLKPMDADFIGGLLRDHTRLFNQLKKSHTQTSLNPRELSDLNLVLVSIWGNSITGVS